MAEVLGLVMGAVSDGAALCLPGNHESNRLKKLKGQKVTVSHGLQESLEPMAAKSPEFQQKVQDFLQSLVNHFVLDDGKLVVAHAGLPETMHGRGSAKVRDFALYGETTGETDEFGLPVRYNWASDYRGQAMVVYGHTPVPQPEWLNHTIDVDTGCVFGGALTALRYPEKTLVEVSAFQTYYDPIPPIGHRSISAPSVQQESEEVLDLDDVTGRRRVATELLGHISILEENSPAALEGLRRFAVDPHWLIYLPPTLSPAATSLLPKTLEHPEQAFAYFQPEGLREVVCEEKHMGSRAMMIVCQHENAAQRRFGVGPGSMGVVYTRSGRPFFEDPKREQELLARVGRALHDSGLYAQLQSDWVLLDSELMPWSLKAQPLIMNQYAAVGRVGAVALAAADNALNQAERRGVEKASDLRANILGRRERLQQFIDVYRRYSWPVDNIEGLRLAPLHLLASEGAVHANQTHGWHLDRIQTHFSSDQSLFQETPQRHWQLDDTASRTDAVQWWEEVTRLGGEGIVVKPLHFLSRNDRGRIIQPAIKVRGRQYLHIIYGPDYSVDANLDRLRHRGLATKQSPAIREFALGVEGLHRFVQHEPSAVYMSVATLFWPWKVSRSTLGCRASRGRKFFGPRSSAISHPDGHNIQRRSGPSPVFLPPFVVFSRNCSARNPGND